MKNTTWLPAFLLPVLLSACGGSDDFQGRYVGPEGVKAYTFMPDGTLEITEEADVTSAEYAYDSSDKAITIKGDADLHGEILTLTDAGNLQSSATTLTRGVDQNMLAEATWIGRQGQFSFSLTSTLADDELQTESVLVTYYDDDMTYMSQSDESITRLTGDRLFLDSTQYHVSDVTDSSFRLIIGENSMTLEKHPKGTEIDIREGYESLDE